MPDNKPLISILIPVYNVADYVEECIDSILKQVDAKTEIILMNDASTDNSFEVISAYGQHSQISILSAPHNRGLSATRNALLPYASGEYIWFIDSDDVMSKGAYKQVLSVLKHKKVDVLCGDYYIWKPTKRTYNKAFLGKSNKIFSNKQESFLSNVIKNNSNHVWNKVFRKELIENISFQEGLKFEDIYYMTDLSAYAFTYSYKRCALIDYRERAGSIVQSMDEKYIDDYLGAFIYRIQAWSARNHQLNGYLLYKSFNRYVSLVKQLAKLSHLPLLKYTMQQYHAVFIAYKNDAITDIGWFRKKKLCSNLDEINKIYDEVV